MEGKVIKISLVKIIIFIIVIVIAIIIAFKFFKSNKINFIPQRDNQITYTQDTNDNEEKKYLDLSID